MAPPSVPVQGDDSSVGMDESKGDGEAALGAAFGRSGDVEGSGQAKSTGKVGGGDDGDGGSAAVEGGGTDADIANMTEKVKSEVADEKC